jgi:hypothetical protein
MMNRVSKKPAAVAAIVGAGLMVLGTVLYIAAGVASAIDYNAQEQVEGAPTTEPPLWIEVLGWASISIGVVGLIIVLLTAAVVVLAALRASSERRATQR